MVIMDSHEASGEVISMFDEPFTNFLNELYNNGDLNDTNEKDKEISKNKYSEQADEEDIGNKNDYELEKNREEGDIEEKNIMKLKKKR